MGVIHLNNLRNHAVVKGKQDEGRNFGRWLNIKISFEEDPLLTSFRHSFFEEEHLS